MGGAMELKLARVHYPVTVLGPGRRVGVWVQGCTIRCAGCMSKDTWSPSGGQWVRVDELANMIDAARHDEALDGLTISGGEPFQQPDALSALITEVRGRWPEADVLVYSGYTLRHLQARFPAVLAQIDALMSGPFVRERPTAEQWRGSANQVLTVLDDRARARYASAASDAGPRLQVAVDDEGLWVLGIPRPGDLARLQRSLAAVGLELEDVSWAE